jgi:hypothetical protein
VEFYQLARDLEGDRPGVVRLVYATAWAPRSGARGRITVLNLQTQEPLWQHELESSGVPASLWEPSRPGTYSAKSGAIGDPDGDGAKEIVIAGAYAPYSPSFLWLLDGIHPPSGVLYHDGLIEMVAMRDLDDDGRDEVVAAAQHDASKGVSLLILQDDQFLPFHSPGDTIAQDPITHAEQSCEAHLVIPAIPGIGSVTGEPQLDFNPDGVIAFHNSKIQIDIRVTPDINSHYLVHVTPPCVEVNVVANMVWRNQVASFLEAGITDIDFVSDTFIDQWKSTFWCGKSIQLSWPPAGP